MLPSKIVAVGLNYKDHAAEQNKTLPAEPMIFLKPSTAVIGPGDPIVIPPGAGRVDHEAEAGVVIGTRSWLVGLIVALHMGLTIFAAIRTEEAFLRERFGDAYDAYAERRAPTMDRRFSVARAWRNKEYRALTGFALAIALLGAKVALG